MSLLGRYNAIVDTRTQTVAYDDGTYDYVEVRNADGIIERRPVAVTPEELRQTEITNLNANRVSVEERLLVVDDVFADWDLLPTEKAELTAERRAGLEAELVVIADRLQALDAAASDPKRRRR